MGYIAECLECNNSFKLENLRKVPINNFKSVTVCPRCESGGFELTYTNKKGKLKEENHSIQQFFGGNKDGKN